MKSNKDRNIAQRILYWISQQPCLHPVPNTLLRFLYHEYSLFKLLQPSSLSQASPSFYNKVVSTNLLQAKIK